MSRASERRAASSDGGGGEGANWMDTYGDLVTLLLTFFVLLFSFSTIDAAKWKSLVGAFSGTNVTPIEVLDPITAMERPIELIAKTEEEIEEDLSELQVVNLENFYQLYENVSAYITENGLGAEIYADPGSSILIIRFTENVLFESGRAVIRPESIPIMDHVINVLNKNEDLINMIRIEGHTDNLPIHTPQFRDNWELSVTRSVNVLRYFIDSGRIDTEKISAVGYGEFHPVESNDTSAGRSKNRRVDFVVQSKPVDRLPD